MVNTQTMNLIHREGLWKLINDGIEGQSATWQQIVPNVVKTKQAYEEIQTHAGLGFFQNFSETQGVTYDTPVPRFTKRYTPIIRTLGVKHTKQTAQKDLYGFVKKLGPMVADSAVATLNLLAANVLNNGFSSTLMPSPDGAALFSASHTIIQNGTVDSNLGSTALSGLALETAIQAVMNQKTDRGIPRYFNGGFNLIVGPSLAGIATRAVESVGLQGTTDNDTNSFVRGSIRKIVVDPLIGFGGNGTQYSWFLVPADAKSNPLFKMDVVGLETATDYDIDHMVNKYVASFETLFDNLGWRGLYGAQV